MKKMNIQKYTLLFALIVMASSVHAQSVSFTYDASGNRVSRNITVNRVRERITTDVQDTASEIQEERVRLTVDSGSGVVIVDILSYKDDERCSISLFTVSGQHLRDITAVSGRTTVDLSPYPAGVYIIRATLNGKAETWKVEIR